MGPGRRTSRSRAESSGRVTTALHGCGRASGRDGVTQGGGWAPNLELTFWWDPAAADMPSGRWSQRSQPQADARGWVAEGTWGWRGHTAQCPRERVGPGPLSAGAGLGLNMGSHPAPPVAFALLSTLWEPLSHFPKLCCLDPSLPQGRHSPGSQGPLGFLPSWQAGPWAERPSSRRLPPLMLWAWRGGGSSWRTAWPQAGQSGHDGALSISPPLGVA